MKVIDLGNRTTTLDEIMGMAEQELVILRDSEGKTFVLSQVDEFEAEVELLKKNKEFMAFLKELSQEKSAISLSEFRQELDL